MTQQTQAETTESGTALDRGDRTRPVGRRRPSERIAHTSEVPASEITVRTSSGQAWLDYWRRQHGNPELSHPMIVASPVRRLGEEGQNLGRRASDREIDLAS